MKQNFNELASGTTFYDPQSHAFFVKRNDSTAAMLYKSEDLGFDGDAFSAKDPVIVIDASELPTLPESNIIKTGTGPLEFSGTVACALDLLDALKSSKKTTNKNGQQMLVQLEKQLRSAVLDFGLSATPVEQESVPAEA